MTENPEAETKSEGQLIVPDGYAEGGDTGPARAEREVMTEEVELLGSLAVHVGSEYNDLFEIEFECPLCKQVLIFRDFQMQWCKCNKVYRVPRDFRIPIDMVPSIRSSLVTTGPIAFG